MQTQFFRILLLLIFSTFFIIASCSDDSSSGGNSVGVENNGLTRDINDFVPDSLVQIIEALGMPVNRGDDPPVIEGYYLASPFILINSNRETDVIGQQYNDYYMRFYSQNSRKLSINLDYRNAGEVGEGLGSFIVGEDGEFSVFSRLTVTVGNDSAYILLLLSGNQVVDAISNLHIALFMLDDLGDPSDYFIENSDGRVFHDSDSLSTEINGFPKQSTLDELIRRTVSSVSDN